MPPEKHQRILVGAAYSVADYSEDQNPFQSGTFYMH